MLGKFLVFCDKLEDKSRKWLSHYPLFYALIGGVGVVLFWRGVWHTADTILEYSVASFTINQTVDNVSSAVWWDGPLSTAIGLVILLMSGIFISSFIGNEIIISGLKGEKKTVEKTEAELQDETETVDDIKKEIKIMASQLKRIEQKMDKK